MRHQRKTVKLRRTQGHRDALLSNLAVSLIEHGRIKTTVAKAKATVTVTSMSTTTHGKKATVSVTLTPVAGQAATGTVTVYVNGTAVTGAVKTYASGSVYKVKATTKALPKGKVTVVYSGNKNLAKATYSSKYTVR